MVKILKHKPTQRYLYIMAGFLHKHAYLVLLFFAVMTLFFGRLAIRLEQKTTIRDLLPADNKVVRNFEETVDNFDLVDRLVIVVKFDPQNLDQAESFADMLVEHATQSEDFPQNLRWLKANLFEETEETNWNQYLQFLLRLMPAEQIPALAQRLTSAGIHEQVAQNRRELETGLASKTMIEKDPLNLIEFAGSYSKEIMGNYQLSFTDGYLVSKTKDMLLILGKPIRSPEDVNYSMDLDDFLQKKIAEAKASLEEEEGIKADEVLQVGLTGPHPIGAHENRTIKGDMINMFASSFATVLLLFIIAYRRPLALFYVGFPLICAEIWTLGLGYLLFGRLNLLTASFSAVIVGLGIDYAIHIFSRYLDERAEGLDPLQAMRMALVETGMGTVIGALTTSLAFLAMSFTNFSGLREFAVLSSLGILLCMFHMFILLPVLIFIRERLRRKKASPPKAQWDFKLEPLMNLVFNHKGLVLTLFIATTILMTVMAIQLRFNTDLRSVRAKSNPSIKLQDEVTAKVGGSLRSLSFVLAADNEADLYALHDSLAPTLTEMKAEGSLVRYDSLLMVLQHPDRQRQNLKALAEAGISGEEIRSSFKDAMEEQKLMESADTQGYIQYLAMGMETQAPMTLQELLDKNKTFVRPFLNKINGKFKTIIHVYPALGLWEKQSTKEITQRVLNAAKPPAGAEIFVTGVQTISDELKLLVQSSFEYTTFLALFLVIVSLYLHFRKLSLILLALAPLVTGVIWMLGTMKLLGIDITVLNFVATPIIIGIGIDDGVHILEKFLHRTDQGITKVVACSAKAVTLTSLTTILGFSSLFLAEYSGFRSLGLCAILGVFYCWVTSVFLLPLLVDRLKISFIREIKLPE